MNVSDSSNGVFAITSTIPLFSPADATTYYLGPIYETTAPITTAQLRQMSMPFNCVLVAASITSNCTQAGVTQEDSTFSVRINNTTDVTLSSVVDFESNIMHFYNITGLNTVFSAGDKWEIKWLTPTWVTNPTNTVVVVTLYFKPL